MTAKKTYIIAFLITIFSGLLSRKLTAIPLITGDILYAIMAYWMFRILFSNKNLSISIISAILFCFTIEFLQLVQAEPLIWLRNHPYLRLIFGQGFLWTDLIAYIIGTFIAWAIDKILISKK